MNSDKNRLLRDQTLFSASSEDVLSWASDMLRIAEYKAGDHICFQGDPMSPLVLLMSGQLRALNVSENGVEIPMGMINPGQSTGESAIVQGLPILANIGVVRKSIVGLFNRADARKLLSEPSISRALNAKLALQLSHLVERHASQGLPRADARISAVIESAISGAKNDEFPLIELPNQATMAAMAKVSRETVSRVLKSLELSGVIAKVGRQVRVRDRTKLHSLTIG